MLKECDMGGEPSQCLMAELRLNCCFHGWILCLDSISAFDVSDSEGWLNEKKKERKKVIVKLQEPVQISSSLYVKWILQPTQNVLPAYASLYGTLTFVSPSSRYSVGDESVFGLFGLLNSLTQSLTPGCLWSSKSSNLSRCCYEDSMKLDQKGLAKDLAHKVLSEY